MSEALKKYCEPFGRQKALAKACDVSPQAVTKWLKTRVPSERVPAVVKATGGAITRHQLRPDIYTSENEAAA